MCLNFIVITAAAATLPPHCMYEITLLLALAAWDFDPSQYLQR